MTRVEQPADVRVIVPYVKPSHRLQTVVDFLRIQYVQPCLARVNDGDAYWNLLRTEWAKGEEFFIVEHDVAVWTGGIAMLQGCSEPWCSLPILIHGEYVARTLGAVKFGKQLVERNPGFWDDIPPTWFQLDHHFALKLGWPLVQPHAHYPPATHLNEIQWPDSISLRHESSKLFWQSMDGWEPITRMGMTEQYERTG